ncbi:helix-turn-helix transcriptional regulator [Kribbella sp. NPDC023855]|uniref:helix-turn-helix transcriptional regulator n=1 Tax=Kribbella sp. NPDC023855 TaxID=3154698 RepID=UPI0033F8AAC7
MDDQAQAVGGRVRYWRKRRGIDRQRFADMVGRSTSWLDKVEKGERSLLRLPMLERVADALNVAPEILTDGPAARRAADCVDATEVQAIRSALGRYPALSANQSSAPPASPGQINQQLDYLGHAWLSSNFTAVAHRLPRLIEDAQVAVEFASTEPDQLATRRSLVMAYRLASSMLLKFDANDVAWLAADRAMQTALPTDDTVALARATRSVARAMTSAGQEADAIAALGGMADRMRPHLPQSDGELLPLFGMLFLAASIAAARIDDPAVALTMHEEADAIAARLDDKHRTHDTIFGPANVAAHRVAALTRLHEGGRALEYVATIDPAIMASLPPERRANHLLDLTASYTYIGSYPEAVQSLNEAERLAPQEIRCRPLAHGLLRALLNSTNGSLSRTVQSMATRAGLT